MLNKTDKFQFNWVFCICYQKEEKGGFDWYNWGKLFDD
jgi:hypothetical protein